MYSRTNLTVHRVAARRMPRPTVQDYLYKFGLVLFIALIFTAADAFSSSGVSPKFDGRYEGAMTPATAFSNPQMCQAVTVDEFVIRGGYIRPPAKISDVQSVVFDGFVTEEGFVTGHFRMPGGERNQFEGRMVDEANGVLLSGGLADSGSGCAYLLELRKAG
ncbi:MAG: hypothetical protein AB7E79_07500 [Rhodospirillaceae bacterium]